MIIFTELKYKAAIHKNHHNICKHLKQKNETFYMIRLLDVRAVVSQKARHYTKRSINDSWSTFGYHSSCCQMSKLIMYAKWLHKFLWNFDFNSQKLNYYVALFCSILLISFQFFPRQQSFFFLLFEQKLINHVEWTRLSFTEQIVNLNANGQIGKRQTKFLKKRKQLKTRFLFWLYGDQHVC